MSTQTYTGLPKASSTLESPRHRTNWLRNHVFSIKTLSLMVISIQTSTMVLLLRYSRTNQDKHYVISTAVLFSELLKLSLSFIFLFIQNGLVAAKCTEHLYKEVILNVFDTFKLAIPALLYVIQNNLLFFALTNLDAATYQVTYQLKILTTAIFSWVMLGKRLGMLHWFSLCCLMIGVSLVQVDSGPPISNPGKTNEESALNNLEKPHNIAHPNPEVSWLLGVLAVFLSCLSSGFSGVYFEKLVKHGKQTSLVIRTIQLGLFSIIFSLMAVLNDRRILYEGGFFQGYSPAAWAVILIQAFGGLMVSVTMKYADNILKGFATSLSIVMSTMVSWLMLGEAAPTLQFTIGATIVITATVMYGVSPQTSNNYDKVILKKRESEIV